MTMTKIALPVAGLLAALSCHLPPPHLERPPSGARRVVLLSHDGMEADRHADLLARGLYTDPDGLAAFPGRGFVVRQAIPVNPTLTSVNHASIATGAAPARTGIVSNAFHLPGTPLAATVSGFDHPWQAEPLWHAFRRQGRRAGVLLFPGADGATTERTADFAMVYVNHPLSAPAEVIRLSDASFAPAGTPTAPGDAPPRRSRLRVSLTGANLPKEVAFVLTAVDTVADGLAAWDTLIVDDDDDERNGVIARLGAGQWFPLRLSASHPDGGTRTVGGWCLLQRLDSDLSQVVIYRGAWYATEAYPRPYRELLDREVGFWPGPGDSRALARRLNGDEGLAIDEYLSQVERFSSYLNACARVTIRHEPFDLLLTYQPIIDEVQHALLIVEPRQLVFNPGLAATADEAIVATYLLADRAVGELARALDLERDALVVVSDHGIAPLWEVVHLNEVLRRAGLAEAEGTGDRQRVSGRSPMAAVGGGGSAHLYVNLAGREADGVVPGVEREQLLRRAAQALALLEVDGQPVVAEMYRREELAPLGLDSPHSGDLVVFMRTGFAATSRIGGPMHEPASYYGQHGHRNTAPGMAAVWMARGAGVPVRTLRRASLTEVAAFVAHLAGVQPPAQAEPWRSSR
jgi:predicted AlkP superfamily phosphohydrolase/phosphomutase